MALALISTRCLSTVPTLLSGFGLVSLRERARWPLGTLQIKSTPGVRNMYNAHYSCAARALRDAS